MGLRLQHGAKDRPAGASKGWETPASPRLPLPSSLFPATCPCDEECLNVAGFRATVLVTARANCLAFIFFSSRFSFRS